MNVRRFVGKNAREAIAQARAVWGDQTVVVSNRPVKGGVEILAMAGAEVPMHHEPAGPVVPALPVTPAAPMSTVSFQQFVRDRQRMDAGHEVVAAPATPSAPAAPATATPPAAPAASAPVMPAEPGRFARSEIAAARAETAQAPLAPSTPSAPAGEEVMAELKSMRGMIAAQLAGMSWFDNVRRSPVQTRLLRLMLGNGFSPSLAREVIGRVPDDVSESQSEWWLQGVLSRNLRCAGEQSIAEQGGVLAVVGPTGVGKTTTTAKIAAQYALKHGASSVGLITVDTYRLGASDQLRGFGNILNIPVHTARDTASLEDLLDLFGKKKLVLIDTVGLGQRDSRLASLFEALPASRVRRLLVLNASAQAETLEEVVQAYGAGPGTRCVFSKIDEAVKCGAAVDVAIRHKLVVEGFANGQRVPEDWHAARAQLLVQKALMKPRASAFTPDDAELGIMLTAPAAASVAAAAGQAQVPHV